MKSLLMISLLLVTSVCQAQVRAVPAGSAEALERINKYRDNIGTGRNLTQAEIAAQNKRESAKNDALKMGKELFGVGVGWENRNYDGTLARKAVKAYTIDDWGFSRAILRVVQVMDEFNLLVVALEDGEALVINGFSTTRVKDGAEFILTHPVVITRTWSYVTTAGNKKTILVLDRNDSLVEDHVFKESPQFKTMIIAKYAKAGAVGKAAYDNFPEAVHDTLVKDWQFRLEALARSIKNYESEIVTYKRSKLDYTDFLKGLANARAEQTKLRRNAEPYVTPETFRIIASVTELANPVAGKALSANETGAAADDKFPVAANALQTARKDGAAAYDTFPQPLRERLIKDWEGELKALERAIEDDKRRLKIAKNAEERKKLERYIVEYTLKLERHKKNDPPYFTKEGREAIVEKK